MTPDELRKRCAECSGDIAWELVNTGNTTKLESLCREMIVDTLETVREKIGRRIDHYSGTHFADPCTRDIQINEAEGCQNICIQEAQRVKEGKS